MHDVRALKDALSRQAEAVARYLLPAGKRRGREWCAGSVDGSEGASLRVSLVGTKAGLWTDFADDQRGGDLLELWKRVRGVTFVEAVREAAAFVGMRPQDLSRQFEGFKPKTYRKPDRPKGIARPKGAVMRYLTEDRGLSEDTVRAYKFAARREKGGDELVIPYMLDDELVFVKYLKLDRPDGKKMMYAEANCRPILFGWQAVSDDAREVVICEGEINAASWHEYGIAALATPYGAGSGHKHDWIEEEYERLARFETIYLDFDPDEAGRVAVADILQRLGAHRCRVVPRTEADGDTNDYLTRGVDADMVRRILTASPSLDPAELRQASSFRDGILEELYPPGGRHAGIELPFRALAERVRLRWAEVTVVTGFSGHGKTTALRFIVGHAMAQGHRVCVASLEDKPARFLRKFTQQAIGAELPTEEGVDIACAWYQDRLWLYAKTGTAVRERLLEVFGYARRRYGVQTFVIDSLLKCGLAEDDYNGQKLFMEDLTNFANETDSHVFIVAHARKADDDSDPPGMHDVRGGAAIGDLGMNGMTVWRDTEKHRRLTQLEQYGDPEGEIPTLSTQPDGLIWFWKVRDDGEPGALVRVWFHRHTGLFSDARINWHSRPNGFIEAETLQYGAGWRDSGAD